MDKIAAGAREQANSLSEANTAFAQMDSVVQQNAAMVEESTASSATLAQEAQALYKLTSHFTIDRAGRPQQQPTYQAQRTSPAPQPIARQSRGSRSSGLAMARAQATDDWAEF